MLLLVIVLVIGFVFVFPQNISAFRETPKHTDEHLHDPNESFLRGHNLLGTSKFTRDKHVKACGAFQG